MIEISQHHVIKEMPFHGLFLGIIDPEKKPPHIVLLNQGHLYHITFRKTFNRVPANPFLDKLRRKHIPSLWLELPDPSQDVHPLVSKFFPENESLPPDRSCLTPINQALNAIFKMSVPEDSMLPDLLNLLTFHNLAVKYFAIDPGNKLPAVIGIGGYTRKEIAENILNLKKQNAERKDNIPEGSRT